MRYTLLFVLLVLVLYVSPRSQSISRGPVPTKQQLVWHEMEFYLFMHFGPNTFTDKEWGEGDEPEDIFNPTELDTDQWCRIAKATGAKGIIITAKHHDGFCLWPSKFSSHTVRESKWKNGKGDVLKELSQACRKNGLKFGVYISPWDRNHPKYGTEAYNDVFVGMMKELFTNYGPIWELWWDGANGEGPNGKQQVYDWKRYEKLVKQLSPQTVIFSDIGPHIRWVGNEKGIASETNWNLLDTAGFKRGLGAPPDDTLQQGNVNGRSWIPAECDVSIRPGWFYHAQEDEKVKTPMELFDLYLKSVGRGANFLLNVPPDRRGLIAKEDSIALFGFYQLLKSGFEKNLAINATAFISPHDIIKTSTVLNDGKGNTSQSLAHQASAGIRFSEPKEINCIVLKEAIAMGQQIKSFKLQLFNGKGQVIKEISGSTIGRKRIISFPTLSVNKVTVSIIDRKSVPALAEIEAYMVPHIK